MSVMLSAAMLHGNGRPTASTVGELGQYYKDDVTGDIYECRVASEYSPLHGAPIPGYRWELRVTGEDSSEHDALYHANRVIICFDGTSDVCYNTYDEAADSFGSMDKLQGMLTINTTISGNPAAGLNSSITVYRIIGMGGSKSSVNFVFIEGITGKRITYRLYSDNTVEKIVAS